MMGPKPFQGDGSYGSISPEKDSVLSGWQCGMRTVCDRESDAGRWRFGLAALCKKHEGEKTEPLDNQEGATGWVSHARDQGLYASLPVVTSTAVRFRMCRHFRFPPAFTRRLNLCLSHCR
jgi:hypothetical protein